MNLPFSLFGQSNRVTPESLDSVPRIAPRTDLQWGRPLFQAPALPTPRQRLEDLQFASDFRSKDRNFR